MYFKFVRRALGDNQVNYPLAHFNRSHLLWIKSCQFIPSSLWYFHVTEKESNEPKLPMNKD
jgi:hypothetical protein